MIATTKRQPEYNKPAGAYVNSIASPQRAAAGLKKEAEWRTTFDAIEKKYQVERWIILAIWGMETSYGALKDKWDVVRSLADRIIVLHNGQLVTSGAYGWTWGSTRMQKEESSASTVSLGPMNTTRS